MFNRSKYNTFQIKSKIIEKLFMKNALVFRDIISNIIYKKPLCKFYWSIILCSYEHNGWIKIPIRVEFIIVESTKYAT